MTILHNLISRSQLKKNMLLDTEFRLTLSFYKYFFIKNPQEYRDQIYKNFHKYKVLGRVYIAYEGINAQISIPKNLFISMKKFLYRFDDALKNIRINKALDQQQQSFWKLTVKTKKKIVSDGIDDPLFDFKKIGIPLKANQVNLMSKDNNVLFIDMRNSYEYAIGHFEKSKKIQGATFREQLKNIIHITKNFKNKKIIMYCTGGIRCEKASAWMIFNGFKYVYHIEGGIIGYVHNAKKNKLPILFKGKNFVFDNRMSEKVSDDIMSSCYQCNHASDNYVNCRYNLCHLLFIQCKKCSYIYKKCCSLTCVEKISISE